METKVGKLKVDFNNIINIRNNVKNIFDILQIRIDKLKNFYSDFIKNNKSQLFIFGLDSFHFQSKLIDIEYDDMKRLFLAITNRMYCEYFKLYKIIVSYISENVTDKKINEIIKLNNYPVYKDLEPFKEYSFDTILEIHENILLLLTSIISNLNNKENDLNSHKSKKDIGLNIDNFITTFNFDITMMREKIMLFLTYIEFFHKMHTKYLKRFSNKIQLMYNHINNDIKFDETIDISKTRRANSDEILYTNRISETPTTPSTVSSNNSDNSQDSYFKKKNMKIINHDEIIESVDSHEDVCDVFSSIESKCDLILNYEKKEKSEVTFEEVVQEKQEEVVEEEEKKVTFDEEINIKLVSLLESSENMNFELKSETNSIDDNNA